MEAHAAGAEVIADRPGDRPVEAQRAGGRRAPQRRARAGAGDGVGAQARPRLEAPQRRGEVRPEAAVDVPGGEAVAAELELQDGDVPAVRAQRQGAATPVRAPAAAERAPRRRADDPVRDEARAGLERAHARARARAGDAVDRAEVGAVGASADLQGGDVAGHARLGAGRRREREHGQRDEEEAGAAHAGSVARPSRTFRCNAPPVDGARTPRRPRGPRAARHQLRLHVRGPPSGFRRAHVPSASRSHACVLSARQRSSVSSTRRAAPRRRPGRAARRGCRGCAASGRPSR